MENASRWMTRSARSAPRVECEGSKSGEEAEEISLRTHLYIGEDRFIACGSQDEHEE